jgi:hypothetical protein
MTDTFRFTPAPHLPAYEKAKLRIDGPRGTFETDIPYSSATKIFQLLDDLPRKKRRQAIRELRDQMPGQDIPASFEEAMARYEIDPRTGSDPFLDLKSTTARDKAMIDDPAVRTALLRGDNDVIYDDELAMNVTRDLDHWTASVKKDTGLVLERAQASKAHLLRQAAEDGHLVLFEFHPGDMASAGMATADLAVGEVFVVEHDWAAAFEGAQDYAGNDDWRLPYDLCCFEFRLSGRHVILTAMQTDDGPAIAGAVELRSRDNAWLVAGGGVTAGNKAVPPVDGLWDLIKYAAVPQIKAICVALEAEVAETEVVRAPHRLNSKREREGKLPLFDHRVVRLGRRSKARPLPPSHQGEPGRGKRLHFRRGHWRHYQGHKTWIKWMLVGNPELGWIEKDYRL